MSNLTMAVINGTIAVILAGLGFTKFGPIGLFCGTLNLVLVAYFLGQHEKYNE